MSQTTTIDLQQLAKERIGFEGASGDDQGASRDSVTR